ncbi:MAG: hypothetical protein LLG42_07710 [Chloroflexi bacterium]|nr:hypothetical protein [Chloroflexota bacterium]
MSINNPEETRPNRVSDSNSKHEDSEAVEATRPISVINDQKSTEKTMPINPDISEEDFVPAMDADQPVMITNGDDSEGMPPDGTTKSKKPKGRKNKWLFILAGLFLIVLIAGVGAWQGYQSGLNMRLNQEYDQVALAAVTQYQLGLEDENAGRLDMARKRYEYVVQLDPSFPGIQERLTAVMLYQAETNVPTIAPTVTPIPVTPTPDMRGIEEKYNAAVAYMRANDWENAINSLEFVRKEDITYRAADIDGMFYIALRFRGIQKISNGNLEPGIYDLTLSALFAPLDNSAESYRSWARYYLTGASFWGVDWASVVEIFGEIYPSMPNMVDSSGWTVQERYRVALINYADLLVSQGKYCEAREYYEQALAMAENKQVEATATAVQLICEPPQPTEEPTTEIIETPTPTVEETTTTPVVEETPAPTNTQEIVPTAETTTG